MVLSMNIIEVIPRCVLQGMPMSYFEPAVLNTCFTSANEQLRGAVATCEPIVHSVLKRHN